MSKIRGMGLVYNKFLTMPFTGAAKTTYESGQLKTVFNFIDGETQGLGEEYYEGGQLKSKFNLTDGKLNGPHETYHENGQLKYSGTTVAADLFWAPVIFDHRINTLPSCL